MKPFDPSAVMEGLKDFQRDTVEYAFRRLYLDDDRVDRFLVADEVGLGKTLVARGVIAKAIDHLRAKGGRTTVVYVCSNAEIARQNISRLNVTGAEDFALASRITLLPIHLKKLDAPLNFVSFTPGTSFNFGHSAGMWRERALLYRLVRQAWGPQIVKGSGSRRVFQGSVGGDFKTRINRVDPSEIDPGIIERFTSRVHVDDHLRVRFETLRDLYTRERKNRPKDERRQRREFVRDLRHILASVCVDYLEPDLVILDEFQRFKNVLYGDDQAAEIAQALFDHPSAKVLLLSATPYKMYTLYEEQADDDHYRDFVDTLRFLTKEGTSEIVDAFRAFRSRLLAGRPDEVAEHRQRVESGLRRVMARTERLALQSNRAGMLSERTSDVPVSTTEVQRYLQLSELTSALGIQDVLEVWKSAPYLLSFMEGYKLKQRVEDVIGAGGFRIARAAEHLRWSDINHYDRIDLGNPRVRGLVADVLDGGAWRLLWVPPSLPYHSYRVPFDASELKRFTKRLIFSAWRVVPKAISTLVSYEVERRVFETRDRFRPYDERQNTPRLLEAKREAGRLTGMPVFGLVYPSPSLAEVGDPLAIARELGGNEPPDVEDVLGVVRGRVAALLAPLLAHAPTDGREDQAWYWAAPVLLDRRAAGRAHWNRKWWEADDLALAWTGDDGSDSEPTHWQEHVAQARSAGLDGIELGRPPSDLEDVVAELALGGPGVTALRALSRLAGGSESLRTPSLRDDAAAIAWGVRNLFNLPEAIEIVRGTGTHRGDDPYWRQVVEYCISGNFQAVLDEYAHVLPEWTGMAEHEQDQMIEEVASTIRSALTLRAAIFRMDELVTEGDIKLVPRSLRGHFALRFGEVAADDGATARPEQVRIAFNSPFWPFVLASTSVGQEGLDFHLYCHAVVHWNLPSNPVDLEQREGRVHRYKGHAIRKNIAGQCREAAWLGGPDPWSDLFDAACAKRSEGESELVPYWVFQGDAQIERHVPMIPLSKDQVRHQALKRTLGAYRLAFGQPRQEDLLAYLNSSEASAETSEDMRIDLSPPRLDR